MRLDINKIEQLNIEKAQIEALTDDIYRANRGTMTFDEFYKEYGDKLHELRERKEAIDEEIIVIKATNINVGDGISLSPYTDWEAFTVIERKDTPKGFKLVIQKDEAIRTDKNGMSDSQTYRFERDPEGRTKEVRWNPRGQWFSADGYKVALGRHEYFDYSF